MENNRYACMSSRPKSSSERSDRRWVHTRPNSSGGSVVGGNSLEILDEGTRYQNFDKAVVPPTRRYTPVDTSTTTKLLHGKGGGKRPRNVRLPEAPVKMNVLPAEDGLSGGSVIGTEAKATPDPVTTEPEDPEKAAAAAKFRKGLQRIRELDKLLSEKSEIARGLKKARQSKSKTNLLLDPHMTSPTAPLPPQANSANDKRAPAATPKHPWKILRLIREMDHLEDQTFLTEPSFEVLDVEPVPPPPPTHVGSDTASVTTSKRGTKRKNGKGDYIQRNIELGPDARFFSSLTKDEQDRVNNLLELLDAESTLNDLRSIHSDDFETKSLASAKVEASGGDQEKGTSKVDMTQVHAFFQGFVPESDELKRLMIIEGKLQQQFPNDFGQFHSELFKRAFDVESQAGTEENPAINGEGRLHRTLSTLDVERRTANVSEINLDKAIRAEKKKVMEIEHMLEQLKQKEEENRDQIIHFDQMTMSRLLQECRREQQTPIDMLRDDDTFSIKTIVTSEGYRTNTPGSDMSRPFSMASGVMTPISTGPSPAGFLRETRSMTPASAFQHDRLKWSAKLNP